MSLDLSDPRIAEAYCAVRAPTSQVDWISLGYAGTNHKLLLYGTGDQGLVELRTKLIPKEVQYGLLRVEGRLLLWTLTPEDVGGVRRARALVHSRAVANAFKAHQAILSATSPADFMPSIVREKLQLDALNGNRERSASPATNHALPPRTLSPAQFSSAQFPSAPCSPAPTNTQEHDDELPALPEKPNFPLVDGVANLSLQSPRTPATPSTPSASAFVPQLPATSCPIPRSNGAPGHPTHHSQPSSSTTIASCNSQSDISRSPTGDFALEASHSGEPSDPAASVIQSPRHLQPQDPRRRQSRDRPTSASPAAAAMLAASDSEDDLYEPAAKTPVLSHSESSVAEVEAEAEAEHQGAEEEALQAQRRALELDQREEAARLERERRERQASELARAEAEREARARSEAEKAERERLDAIERRRLEAEELARREAAARLRREEERVALEREREEAERQRREEEERTRQAREEMRLLIEREKLERKLREEEELKRMEVMKVREQEERQKRFVALRDAGEVMLRGAVSVQGGSSMLWRRRHFELRGSALSLLKNEAEADRPLDTILTSNIARITDNPEEALVPNSFKMTLRDDDEYLFYADEKDDKELLVAGIKIAARI
ncbi:hypothetical protein JCM21900_001578 [Sporobolomyces salmonicolor]